MYSEYLRNIRTIGGFQLLTKSLNFLKIILIGNISGATLSTERFFIVCGIIFPLYYIVESIAQAYLIPLFSGLEEKFRDFYSTRYICRTFLLSVPISFSVFLFSFFERTDERMYAGILVFIKDNS